MLLLSSLKSRADSGIRILRRPVVVVAVVEDNLCSLNGMLFE
jgi:hypothetical protein